MFGRALISLGAVSTRGRRSSNARARDARVEATSDRPCPAQVKRALFAGGGDRFADLHFLATGPLDAGGLDVAGSSGAGNATILKQDASILGWTCGNVVATATAAARFFHDLLVAKTLLNATTLAEAETCVQIKSSTRLQCARIRMF